MLGVGPGLGPGSTHSPADWFLSSELEDELDLGEGLGVSGGNSMCEDLEAERRVGRKTCEFCPPKFVCCSYNSSPSVWPYLETGSL